VGNLEKVAGAGLEQVAPNLLLFLVLQDCSSDVPTLLPTLDTKIASFDCALDPNVQSFGGNVSSLSVSAPPPYSFELDTVGQHVRPVTNGDTGNDTQIMKGVNYE